jgi:hypothetical protein
MSSGVRELAATCCHCRLFAVALGVVVMLNRIAAGDETRERAAGMARLAKTIESYSITMEGDKSGPLELVKAPVLRYSDAISPVSDGLVFVWTKAGRPEALMAAHHGTEGRTWLEFRSLSQSPLTATWQENVEWSPQE